MNINFKIKENVQNNVQISFGIKIKLKKCVQQIVYVMFNSMNKYWIHIFIITVNVLLKNNVNKTIM